MAVAINQNADRQAVEQRALGVELILLRFRLGGDRRGGGAEIRDRNAGGNLLVVVRWRTRELVGVLQARGEAGGDFTECRAFHRRQRRAVIVGIVILPLRNGRIFSGRASGAASAGSGSRTKRRVIRFSMRTTSRQTPKPR